MNNTPNNSNQGSNQRQPSQGIGQKTPPSQSQQTQQKTQERVERTHRNPNGK